MFKLCKFKNFVNCLLTINKNVDKCLVISRRTTQNPERTLSNSWLINNNTETKFNKSAKLYSSFSSNLKFKPFVDTAATEIRNYELKFQDSNELHHCAPTTWQFTVQLDLDLEPNERVGLTGNVKALGEWKIEQAIDLHRRDNLQWIGNVVLPCSNSVQYRYFIFVEDKFGYKQIRRWETHSKPRMIKPHNTNYRLVDRFGEKSTADVHVSRGWLTNETIVQLKFEREAMFQINDDTDFSPDNIYIKVLPLNKKLEAVTDDAAINVEVAKMLYGESQLQNQDTLGILYKSGDIIIFHITVPHSINNGFALIFHSANKHAIAKAIITPDKLLGSEGTLTLSITKPDLNSNEHIAQLHLPYLIVKPFNDISLDFSSTYAHSWPKSWPKLDVGHRGNGRSYISDPPAERENTIASFLRAFESNADMVELDVHLTSDGVPVIYHDFGVRTADAGVTITDVTQLKYVLIKDLTYDDLKDLRIFAIINNTPVEFPSHNAEIRHAHRVFPKLVEVFERLPETLGIDVEIKWPQRTASGGLQARQTIDKNFFVDRVLNTVISHACDRPLVFSSFDADLCTMLRFKQNLFPVLFLTNGQTKKWPLYMDLRTRSFEQAINHAQAFELAGTAPHAEDFLGDKGIELMSKAHNLGQTTLVWGDDINSKERVKYFNNIGATAICYDRADLYLPEGKKGSFFDSTDVKASFNGRCAKSS